MKLTKKDRIGIWGFGITGKAIATYFLKHGHSVGIMDQKRIILTKYKAIYKDKIVFFPQTKKRLFFSSYDFFFVSPGINMGCYLFMINHLLINELDFFQKHFKKPIIAITGSIGKTSITHSLASIFKVAQIPTFVGGNIGTATFDALDLRDQYAQALLEVSSFQLDQCRKFAPDLAIWTNFYENHLDYHETEENYFFAKYNIIKCQKKYQHSLIPLSLRKYTYNITNRFSYFTTEAITKEDFCALNQSEHLYYIADNTIVCYYDGYHTPIISLSLIPPFTFTENILILVGACDILNISLDHLKTVASTITLPEHRLEPVATNTNILFYNDSKGTTTTATRAAVEKLYPHHTIHLFLGGLSKGVDREDLIKAVHDKVKHIYCFGAESAILYEFCTKYDISAYKHSTLPEAFDACTRIAQSGECVLFSPSGSSYDLYKDYQERGNHFKTLVKNFAAKGE